MLSLVSGWATFLDAKSVNVDTDDGPLHIEAEHVIMAMALSQSNFPSSPSATGCSQAAVPLTLKEVLLSI